MDDMNFSEFKKSSISDDIIALNFKNVEGNSAYENLLYALDESARRNDGRLRDNWLKKYQHLDHGGWWCNGIDLKTLNPSEWGCLKPNKPRIINGKPIKYEHPPNTSTGVFALEVSPEKFANFAGKKVEEIESQKFWQWVIDNPVAITVTEGAKKSACLLSYNHVSVALPGIWNGVKDGLLIEQLQVLTKVNREFIIAFDQDAKWTTRNDVFRATRKLGDSILSFNPSCQISVLEWEVEEGKGIDDLVSNFGQGRLEDVYEERLSLEEYIEKYGEVKYLKRPQLLDFILRTLGKKLEFNEMSQTIELDGEELIFDDTLVFNFIEKYRIQSSKDALFGALLYVAKKHSYHPVERYLTNCASLDPIRIDNLASRYFKTTEPLYDFFLQQWLIAAVARALEPGCKADYALLLQSPEQGIGKSTFFSVLGGKWYVSSLGNSLDHPKTLSTFHDSWINEWDEFDRVSTKSDFDVIKSFLTRAIDKFVPQYGRQSLTFPRRFIMAGSINKNEFLRDPTGARRFLVIPIPLGVRIDNELLKKERDRIWAGAVKAYVEGKKKGLDPWVLPADIEQKISDINRSYSVTDEWEFMVEEYLENKDKVSITEILELVFKIEPGKQDRSAQMRVSYALTKLHWNKAERGIDDQGCRRQLWRPIAIPSENSDIPTQRYGTNENPHTDSFSAKGNKPDHDSPPYLDQGMAEVWQKVWQNETQDVESVSEVTAIPAIPDDANFPRKTLERPKIVNDDQEDEDEIRIGDRIVHFISKETGQIIWLSHDQKECQIRWDDPTLGTSRNLYTHYVRKNHE